MASCKASFLWVPDEVTTPRPIAMEPTTAANIQAFPPCSQLHKREGGSCVKQMLFKAFLAEGSEGQCSF